MENYSNFENIKSGAPQGFILGPPLSLMNENDLQWNVQSTTVLGTVYADDTAISLEEHVAEVSTVDGSVKVKWSYTQVSPVWYGSIREPPTSAFIAQCLGEWCTSNGQTTHIVSTLSLRTINFVGWYSWHNIYTAILLVILNFYNVQCL